MRLRMFKPITKGVYVKRKENGPENVEAQVRWLINSSQLRKGDDRYETCVGETPGPLK